MALNLHNWLGATAIALSFCVAGAVTPALAQEVKQPAQEPSGTSKTAETTDTTADTTQTTESSLSAEEQELDPLLLGPWAKMTGLVNTPLTNEVVNKAVARCKTTMQLSRLNFGSDVDRSLPTDKAHFVGDIVYYRTPKGIQRLDNRTDSLVLLPKVEKTTSNGGRVVWHLTNNRSKVLLRFTNTSSRGGTGEFVASNDGIYLRCIRNPTAASQ